MRLGLAVTLCCFAGACVCAPPIPAPNGGAAGGSAGGGACVGRCRAPPSCPAGTQLGNGRFCGEGCEPAGCQCLDCICYDCVDAGSAGGGGAGGGGGGGGGGGTGGGCPGGVTFICPPRVCDFDNRCPDRKRCADWFCGPTCCTGPLCGGIDCVCNMCMNAGPDDEGSPCATSQTCSGDGECRPDAGVCQNACRLDAQCRPGQTCIGGVCKPAPQYGVCSYFGGLNHLAVGRFDPITRLCVVVHLAEPYAPQLTIGAPGAWGVVSARAEYSDGGCPASGLGGSGGVFATGGTGRVDFDAGSILPADVAVHATLTFPPDSGVPPLAQLNASGITQCR